MRLTLAKLVVICSSVLAAVADHVVDIQGAQTKLKPHSINLKKPDDDRQVFNDNLHILNVDVDEVTGQLKYSKWSPSKDTNKRSNAVIHYPDKQSIQFQFKKDNNSNSTYLHRNSSPASNLQQSNAVNAVVELVFVCDKEFGDVFDHDNQRILDYWIVYMWDLNLRYKTLPSVNISFRVNGIIVISSFAAQPFIEEARASDGRAEFGRILGKYSTWIYSQRGSIPKHDLAPLVTNTALEWTGGLAFMNGACWVHHGTGRDLGIPVFNDAGNWGSVTLATQQLGYSLGAFNDDDPDYPGGCDQTGFIMEGGNDEHRYFFSECSDRTISAYLNSDKASCLQTINDENSPALDPSYSSPKAPTMDEMCKRVLNSTEAFILEEDTFNCKTMRCQKPDGIYFVAPVENIVCGAGGRCFRGICRPTGYTFRNEGSGLCMTASTQFEFMATLNMITCPVDGTPLERFIIISSPNGDMLGSPFLYNNDEESGDKCVWAGNPVGTRLLTDRCNPDNPWHGWDFQDSGNGKFLLKHRVTSSCAKPEDTNVGSAVISSSDCNPLDQDLLWTKFL